MRWRRQTSSPDKRTADAETSAVHLRQPPRTGYAVLETFISTARPSPSTMHRATVVRTRRLRRDDCITFRLLQGKRCIVWRRQMIHDSERRTLAGLAACTR